MLFARWIGICSQKTTVSQIAIEQSYYTNSTRE
jgi:hypothetical protein